MLDNRVIGFVGAGNMAEALIKGLLAAGASRRQLLASDHKPDRVTYIHKAYGIRTTADNREVVRAADIVVLAVKPQILPKVLDEIAEAVGPDKLVVSIAAGVPIEAIEAHLPRPARIVRVMPNTPALVQAGAAALVAGRHATEADVAAVKTIFDSVGRTVLLDDEGLMDAVTGLSGSGPAYVFVIIDALADAGVRVGLSREVALPLAAQTVLGAAKMLLETGEHPGALKDKVTSPGGTAIAGLHTLEQGGLRTTIINAVEAATRRARELGEEARAKRSGGR
ncbi:MAG TPA: pyrroline-5-carboxylate reductase [Thermodesulfobacteriota bacterium]|nr:pyrroline-5-carboxylate reductase [Thermodesulfobacteriota bacterium]